MADPDPRGMMVAGYTMGIAILVSRFDASTKLPLSDSWQRSTITNVSCSYFDQNDGQTAAGSIE